MNRPPFDPNLISTPADERPISRHDAVLTVSQLTGMVKRAIEQHLPPTVHVVGEISNFKRHSSRHLYFVLKDEHCEVACVMWRASADTLKFDPADGLEVFATGHVDVFERSGRYQLYVRRLEPKGVGALELAFRQVREKLEKEGLFDTKHKKPLPPFPQRIAVVTSMTGAAIRDILKTLARRWPATHVYLFPVTVQGPTAAGEIARAIQLINSNAASFGGIDVMIVGRGGGSLEDLWAFNEEIVARAVFASAIPVVSAVGHEADVSISDLVADVRAATPTAAAELIVPHREEVASRVESLARHLTRATAHGAAMCAAALGGLLQRTHWRAPLTLVRLREQAVDELATGLQHTVAKSVHQLHRWLAKAEVALQRIRPDVYTARNQRRLSDTANRLERSADRRLTRSERSLAALRERFATAAPSHRWDRMNDRVAALAAKLDAMSHKSTLRRGFSITRAKKGHRVVRSSTQIHHGDILWTETADGSIESRVMDAKQPELFD